MECMKLLSPSEFAEYVSILLCAIVVLVVVISVLWPRKVPQGTLKTRTTRGRPVRSKSAVDEHAYWWNKRSPQEEVEELNKSQRRMVKDILRKGMKR